MIIDFEKISAKARYFIMTQTVVPRPIAWVLSDSGKSNFNLAPFSYFNAVCSEPPLIIFSVGKKASGEVKDTLLNIKNKGEFVVHIASSQSAKKVSETSKELAHGDSEVLDSKLELVELPGFSMPRLKECKIAMGCTSYKIDYLGPNKQALIFGEVKKIYIDDSCSNRDMNERVSIDIEKLDPLGRLGGADYATIGEILSVPRPK